MDSKLDHLHIELKNNRYREYDIAGTIKRGLNTHPKHENNGDNKSVGFFQNRIKSVFKTFLKISQISMDNLKTLYSKGDYKIPCICGEINHGIFVGQEKLIYLNFNVVSSSEYNRSSNSSFKTSLLARSFYFVIHNIPESIKMFECPININREIG